MSGASVNSIGSRACNVEGGPRFMNRNCWCGRRAEVKISESEKNPGRLYYKCAEKKCEFWDWCVANEEKQRMDSGRFGTLKMDSDSIVVAEICGRMERIEMAFGRARNVLLILVVLIVVLTVVVACLAEKSMYVSSYVY